MKYLKFKIDIYDWDIYYIEVEKKKDLKAVIVKLSKLKMPHKIMVGIRDDIKDGATNGGHHWCHTYERKTIVLLYKTTSKRNRTHTIFHEKRHIEDRILHHLGIDDIEASAFLAGYIAEKLIPIL